MASTTLQPADTDTGAVPTPSLPPAAYTDPVLYEQELAEVYGRSWILVGHASEVARPGQYLTADVGYEPVVVVRGYDGVLRALSNVCRHRASTILEGAGTVKRVMRCPYHAWTYDLDGQLAAAPQARGFACLDRDSIALPQFQVEVVDGAGLLRARPGGAARGDARPRQAVPGDLRARGPRGLRLARARLPQGRGVRGELEDPGRQLPRGLPRARGAPGSRAAHGREEDLRRVQRVVRVVRAAAAQQAVARREGAPLPGDRPSRARHAGGHGEALGPHLHLAGDVHGALPAPCRHLAARPARPAVDAGPDLHAHAPRRRPGHRAGPRPLPRAAGRRHGARTSTSPPGCSVESVPRRTRAASSTTSRSPRSSASRPSCASCSHGSRSSRRVPKPSAGGV